jgi:hypothetical protein
MLRRLLTSFLLILCIGLPGMAMAAEEYWEYTFRPGDSLWKIAEQYTTSVNNWGEILRLNSMRMEQDRSILPGTRIIIPVSMLKQKPTPARVIALNGAARLIRADGEKVELSVGMLLYSGDRVVTGDGQSVRMQFADKSELQVLPTSEVVLDKLSYHKQNGMVDTRIRLNFGSVDTRVEKQQTDSRYEIKTPAAITAVRGTAFRLSSDADQISRTEVGEGLVGVSAGNIHRAVKEGYGLVAEKGKPLPEPVKLLPATELGDNQSAKRFELTLSWSKLDGAKYYRYQLASDAQFNQISIDDTTVENSIERIQLAPGHYFVRVRGVDQYKLEGMDAVREIEILQPPVEQDSSWKVIMPIGILLLVL